MRLSSFVDCFNIRQLNSSNMTIIPSDGKLEIFKARSSRVYSSSRKIDAIDNTVRNILSSDGFGAVVPGVVEQQGAFSPWGVFFLQDSASVIFIDIWHSCYLNIDLPTATGNAQTYAGRRMV
jgi:hypothetical protein